MFKILGRVKLVVSCKKNISQQLKNSSEFLKCDLEYLQEVIYFDRNSKLCKCATLIIYQSLLYFISKNNLILIS